MSRRTGQGCASAVTWGAVLSVVAPLLTAMLVLAAMGARLEDGFRRVDAGLARVASSWLADRVAPLPAARREVFIADAGRRMGALAGLHDRESGFAGRSALAALAAADIERVLSQDIGELEIDGGPHQVAATSLRPPLSRLSVVLAVPPRKADSPRPEVMLRLALVAALFLLAAAVFGACVGLDFGAGLERLARRLSATGRSGALAGAGTAEVAAGPGGIEGAATRLESRAGPRAASRARPAGEAAVAGDDRGDLLSIVARDLHRPLRSIVDTTGALLEGRDGDLAPPQREDILVVRQAGLRLLGLLDDILDLTTLMGTEIRLTLEPVALAEVAEEVTRAARGEARKKRLGIDLEIEPGPPLLVRGDRQRLWQVLTNLVGNAVKFTERGGVAVRVGRDPDHADRVRLEVADTGVGIPSMDQASVFDTFRQIRARAQSQRGSGLGLAISRRLVELHGGTIRVDSEVGRGARFVVLLPEER